jgi:hypothetical protein
MKRIIVNSSVGKATDCGMDDRASSPVRVISQVLTLIKEAPSAPSSGTEWLGAQNWSFTSIQFRGKEVCS